MGFKIAHIADVHWRSLSRHDEYRRVFEYFCNDIRERGADAVLVAGDIFHTKTLGISPEFIELLTWWLKSISNVVPVHITLGNHDGNLVNLSRQDAISPVVNAIGDQRVKLYKKSGVYPMADGIDICVFSVFDRHGWKDVRPTAGRVSIATYHGPVIGSETESDFHVNEGVDVSMFDPFDFVMLGDIHKQQYLSFRDVSINEKVVRRPWIAYPGSAIQQNYAEAIAHGYLFWDIAGRDEFDVDFVPLPNEKPYVTLGWAGSVDATLANAAEFPIGTRFRIKSDVTISQHDTSKIVHSLSECKKSTEITFAISDIVKRDTVTSGELTIAKDDLRNVEVIKKLLRSYYAREDLSVDDWREMEQIVDHCVKEAMFDDTPVNVLWSLKTLEFDNLYCYGSDNKIAFDKLSGIVGIFGKNRIGKSSIPGAIMYVLYNSSDRGKLKNIHVMNARKQTCAAKASVIISGTEYVIERHTSKRETKRGVVASQTTLEVFRVDGAEMVLLNAEQRSDTEKVVRSLIGSEEDFCVTSMSTQGEHNNVISMGSAKRKMIFAKFLNLDVFDKLHDIVKVDVNVAKSSLRSMQQCDWAAIISGLAKEIVDGESELEVVSDKIKKARESLDALRDELNIKSRAVCVPIDELLKQRELVEALVAKRDAIVEKLSSSREKSATLSKRVDAVSAKFHGVNVDELRDKIDKARVLETSMLELRHAHERERNALTNMQRSLKILRDVPCGDAFPACKFIKDAYANVAREPKQVSLVDESGRAFAAVVDEFNAVKVDDLRKELSSYEAAKAECEKLSDELSKCNLNIVKIDAEHENVLVNLGVASQKLEELERQASADNGEEIVTLRDKVSRLTSAIAVAERERVSLATHVGKLHERVEKLRRDKDVFERVQRQFRVNELVANAFNKKGIPTSIVDDQLPLINAEISKLLAGIVDFTVELMIDEETNDLDIFIDYGDSRRIIELCSGMEKMVSSIAIRVALASVSTLPKPNMLVIDEGFGALDDGGVDAVNRLLESLKSKFRMIIVITHVEGVKDIADHIIEVTRDEHDSHVSYV